MEHLAAVQPVGLPLNKSKALWFLHEKTIHSDTLLLVSGMVTFSRVSMLSTVFLSFFEMLHVFYTLVGECFSGGVPSKLACHVTNMMLQRLLARLLDLQGTKGIKDQGERFVQIDKEATTATTQK